MPKSARRPWIQRALNTAVKYAPQVAKGVRSAMNYRRVGYKQSGGVKQYAGVTQQHDRARVYKKKYMRKGKKRAWKKFVKKVQAVNLKDRGLVTALYNNVFNPVASGPASQLIFEMHLYGFKSPSASTAAGCNDLGLLTSSDWQVAQDTKLNSVLSGSGIYLPQSTSSDYRLSSNTIQFESAILDATVTNNNSGTIELDVYFIRYKKFTKGNNVSLAQTFSNAADTYTGEVQPSTGSDQLGVTLENRGCTPFELGKGISMAGMQILSKEKYLISSGQAITLQMRDAKNRYYNGSDFYDSSNSFKYKDWTQTYLLIGKKVIEDDTAMTLRIGCTRSYKYTFEGLKSNKVYRLTV